MRAESREQLLQTGSAVLDETAERHDLLAVSSLQIKDVGFDSLVGRDGESCDAVLQCGEGLDRTLPAHVRIGLSQDSIGGEIVDRDRDHEEFDASRSVLFIVQDVVRQQRFLDISACAEQLAGRSERFWDFGDDSRWAENRELRPSESSR